MITIDGAQGKGGGQILRSSLTMAICTGQAVALHSIRKKRNRSGLMRQHLTAVRAAAAVCGGTLTGDELGSGELTFRPGAVCCGEYHLPIGTAGSTSLVLQTILPALLLAEGPSVLHLEGGTHNPGGPPFDFLQKAYLPLLGRMGARVTAELLRPGFYPAGGGRITVRVQPAPLAPLSLIDRGSLEALRATARVAHLPASIAQRELNVVQAKLGRWSPQRQIEEINDSVGPGNVLHLEIESEHVTEVCTGFGEKGRSAERVAARAVREARHYLASEVAVGEHLADQLLLPMVLAGGGEFSTIAPSLHSTTNATVLRTFTGAEIEFAQDGGAHRWRATVRR